MAYHPFRRCTHCYKMQRSKDDGYCTRFFLVAKIKTNYLSDMTNHTGKQRNSCILQNGSVVILNQHLLIVIF